MQLLLFNSNWTTTVKATKWKEIQSKSLNPLITTEILYGNIKRLDSESKNSRSMRGKRKQTLNAPAAFTKTTSLVLDRRSLKASPRGGLARSAKKGGKCSTAIYRAETQWQHCRLPLTRRLRTLWTRITCFQTALSESITHKRQVTQQFIAVHYQAAFKWGVEQGGHCV